MPGTVSERLESALEDERKGGGINRALQSWVVAGFQLQELGGGILETWLALEKNGELAGMSKDKRARVLVNLLERLDNLETTKPPAKSKPAAKVQSAPAPISLDDMPDQLADI